MSIVSLEKIWQPDIQQKNYRAILKAMANPATIQPIIANNTNVESVAKSVLATLLDSAVSLSDPQKNFTENDWILLQAKKSTVNQADFILHQGKNFLQESPKLGTLESPENSATIVLMIENFTQGNLNLKCTGAGIKKINQLNIQGLSEQWIKVREEWTESFPLGVDFLLVDSKHVCAIPRTTKIEVG